MVIHPTMLKKVVDIEIINNNTVYSTLELCLHGNNWSEEVYITSGSWMLVKEMHKLFYQNFPMDIYR